MKSLLLLIISLTLLSSCTFRDETEKYPLQTPHPTHVSPPTRWAERGSKTQDAPPPPADSSESNTHTGEPVEATIVGSSATLPTSPEVR